MFALKINSEFLDLLPDASVSLEINNPIFADDVIPGTYSLPFDLPDSPVNRRILSYPNLINLANKPKLKYSGVELWIMGLPWKSGDLIFRGYSQNRYKVNFQGNTSLLGDILKDLNINELEYDDVQLVDWSTLPSPGWGNGFGDGKKYIKIECDYGNLPNPLNVTINGTEYTDDNAVGFTRATNVMSAINNAGIGIIMDYDAASQAGEIHKFYIVSTEAGITVPFDILFTEPNQDSPVFSVTQSYIGHYLIYAQQALDSMRAYNIFRDFAFPTCEISGFWGSGVEGLNMQEVFNFFADDGFLKFTDTKNVEGELVKYHYSVIPWITLGGIMHKLEALTGIRFIGDFVESIVPGVFAEPLQRGIFFNAKSLSYFETLNGQVWHTFVDTFNPADHLPKMTAIELLLALKKLFALGFDYNEDNQTIELYKLKPIIDNNQYVDHTHKFDPDYSFEYNYKEGIILKYDQPKDETYEDIEASPLAGNTLGKGEIEVVSKLTPLVAQVRQKPFGSGSYKIPFATLEGGYFGQDVDIDPRLMLFWEGQPDSLGNTYRFASHDNLDIDGIVLGDDTLLWTGDSGLYERYWKGWAEFLQEDIPSTRTAYWTVADLLNFDFKKKYRIDQVRYFIKKIKFTVNGRRLLPASIELMKAE